MQLDLERRPNTANISADGVYRYMLTRELGGERVLAAFGLNPSKATADLDDHTIRKDMGFAKRWACGRLIKPNAYAYRATDPNDMKRARKSGVDVIGPENDEAIRGALELVRTTSGILLVAWGNHIEPKRQRDIAHLIHMAGVAPMCFGTNQNGTPVHELYQPYERELRGWVHP